jgi:hypothetical protein
MKNNYPISEKISKQKPLNKLLYIFNYLICLVIIIIPKIHGSIAKTLINKNILTLLNTKNESPYPR